MSTIIEPPSVEREAGRFLGSALIVLAIWFAGLTVSTALVEPTRTVAVFGPSEAAWQALRASDSLLIGGGDGYVIVRGQRQGFVRELYGGGAWLVLPVSRGGCRGRSE
jgi:hypothetical protein